MDVTEKYLPSLYSAIRLFGMHYRKVGKGWSYSKHHHQTYIEFLYCAEGQLIQVINGQHYELQPGDALIIKPNVPHWTLPIQYEKTALLCFHFLVEVHEVQALFHIVSDPIIRDPFVKDWYEELMKQYRKELVETVPEDDVTKSPFSKWHTSIKMLGLQTQVLIVIYRLAEKLLLLYQNKLHEYNSITPAQLKVALDLEAEIASSFRQGIKINELAEKLNMNRSYLSNCFSSVFGISPSDYSNRLRIGEARVLLKETTHSVEHISQMLAFSSTAHFSKAFRTATNKTPLEYRNS